MLDRLDQVSFQVLRAPDEEKKHSPKSHSGLPCSSAGVRGLLNWHLSTEKTHHY